MQDYETGPAFFSRKLERSLLGNMLHDIPNKNRASDAGSAVVCVKNIDRYETVRGVRTLGCRKCLSTREFFYEMSKKACGKYVYTKGSHELDCSLFYGNVH